MYGILFKEEVARLYVLGHSFKEIVAKTGISKSTYLRFKFHDKVFAEAVKKFRAEKIENFFTAEKKEETEISTEVNSSEEKNAVEKKEDEETHGKSILVSDMIEKSKKIISDALDSGDKKIALEVFKIYRPRDEGLLAKVVEKKCGDAQEKNTITELATFFKLRGGSVGEEMRSVSNG